MYQNYSYLTQATQSQMPRTAIPQSLTLKGRPVASLEEVRATGIDFDGSIFYFPDLANKRIYTKQINLDGTASLNMYELKEIPPEIPIAAYITREEFEAALSQIQASLNALNNPTTEAAASQPAPVFTF